MDLVPALCVILMRVGGNVTSKAVTMHGMNRVKKMYKRANLKLQFVD